jgi:hypothetical protein
MQLSRRHSFKNTNFSLVGVRLAIRVKCIARRSRANAGCLADSIEHRPAALNGPDCMEDSRVRICRRRGGNARPRVRCSGCMHCAQLRRRGMSANHTAFLCTTCADARGMVDPIILLHSLRDTLNIGSLDGSRKRTVNRPRAMNGLSGLELATPPPYRLLSCVSLVPPDGKASDA